ncbi:MAG: winged helix DNA-binding domain-containing protein, partial [Streptosporangiales bacterium]
MEVRQEQVLAWRMHRQLLAGHGDTANVGVAEVAARLCGVQAHVASAAVLAIGVRRRQRSDEPIQRALREERTLVKMWSARGALHLLEARQAPLLAAAMGSLAFWERSAWLRGHGVTAAEQEQITQAVGKVVHGRVLTRDELVDEVVEACSSRHLAKALRSGWGALLKPAAMQGLLCHGPPDGHRVTFTSPRTWLPTWSTPEPDEAGRAAVRAYLGSFGPATHDDFAQWLARNTRPRVTRPWFASLADELTSVTVDGKHGWLLTADVDELRHTRPSRSVRLLPAFDQYVIAVARDLIPAEHKHEVSRPAGWISPVVLRGGRVAGVWEVDGSALEVRPFEHIGKHALTMEAKRLARVL